MKNKYIKYLKNTFTKIPKETIKFDDIVGLTFKLVLNTDYILEYEDNIYAGIGKVIVIGLNNYTGTLELEFTINKIPFKIPDINNIKYIYDGTMKYALPNSERYAVTGDYEEIEVGKYKAYLVLNDKVNYYWENGSTDNVEFEWEIIPGNEKTVVSLTSSNNKVTLNWELRGCSGYKVYRSTTGKKGSWKSIYKGF